MSLVRDFLPKEPKAIRLKFARTATSGEAYDLP
ncbi:hypothetical protein HNQ64_001480 [Prosthecobacter dejongeii]|uniref:Uncharacterized protein n=1 Tax=Prosthecobacter dejongeii TaxID=48465 RepID=A0A7W7YJA2_9BACT|nr:hypothetical protein [Prosthecobacter dejongeii]